MLGCDRVFRILSSSFSLPELGQGVPLVHLLTAQEDLNLFPAGDLLQEDADPVAIPQLGQEGDGG